MTTTAITEVRRAVAYSVGRLMHDLSDPSDCRFLRNLQAPPAVDNQQPTTNNQQPKEKIMTELQSPQRKSYKAKAFFGLLLAVVMVGAFATAASAKNTDTPRSGELRVTKECSQYSGNAGGFCTILGSNLNAIDGGMKVIYTSAPVFPCLCSDLVLDGPGNNNAYGHVTLDLQTFTGLLTFSGGTGRFSGFHATVAVTVTSDGVWHWDGTYSFTSPGHDKHDKHDK